MQKVKKTRLRLWHKTNDREALYLCDEDESSLGTLDCHSYTPFLGSGRAPSSRPKQKIILVTDGKVGETRGRKLPLVFL